jgi:hypothetical protein
MSQTEVIDRKHLGVKERLNLSKSQTLDTSYN